MRTKNALAEARARAPERVEDGGWEEEDGRQLYEEGGHGAGRRESGLCGGVGGEGVGSGGGTRRARRAKVGRRGVMGTLVRG